MAREHRDPDYLANAMSVTDGDEFIAEKVARKFGNRRAIPRRTERLMSEPPVEIRESVIPEPPILGRPFAIGESGMRGAAMRRKMRKKTAERPAALRAEIGPLALPEAVENPRVTAIFIARK